MNSHHSREKVQTTLPPNHNLKRLFFVGQVLFSIWLGLSLNAALADMLYVGKKDGTIDMIDTATNKTVANLSTGFAPIDSDMNIAISPSGNRLYVYTIGKYHDFIKSIDPSSDNVLFTTELSGGMGSSRNISDIAGTDDYVYMTSGGGVQVLDTKTNKLVSSIATQGWYSSSVAMQSSSYLYVNDEDSFSIVNLATNAIEKHISVSLGSCIAVNPSGTRIYTNVNNNLTVIDANNGNVVTTLAVGNYPSRIAVNLTGTRVYVLHRGGISEIDTATNSTLNTIAIADALDIAIGKTVPIPSPNKAPTASFEVRQENIARNAGIYDNNSKLYLDASNSSDPEGKTLTYQWTSQPPLAIPSEKAPILNIQQSNITYTFTLVVKDDKGLVSAPVNKTITMIPNQQPKASFTISPSSDSTTLLTAPLTVTLDASSSADPENKLLTYYWVEPTGLGLQHIQKQTVTIPTGGTYKFTLWVEDELSYRSEFVSKTITVASPPVASFTVTPTTGKVPMAVTLDASLSSDPYGNPLTSYEWTSQPALSIPAEKTPKLTLLQPTTYTFTLVVKNAKGSSSTPVSKTVTVSNNPNPVSINYKETISASEAGHICSLKADGKAICWGNNSYGQASPPDDTFTQISTGSEYSCGLKTNMQIKCWGRNDNDVGQASPPSGAYLQISTGSRYACALDSSGQLIRWGTKDNINPSSFVFTQVSCTGIVSYDDYSNSYYSHSNAYNCGIMNDSSVLCWSWDAKPAPSGAFKQVSTGYGFACGLKTNGNAVCWGDNAGSPFNIPSSDIFTQISAGTSHVCALKTDGRVACWGSNNYGQATPPSSGSFTQITAGKDHSCAVKTDNSVICWGAGKTNTGKSPEYGQSMVPSIIAGNSPNYTLVSKFDGNGKGKVTATGLTCTSTECTGSYATGTVVNLTATADAGSAFVSWSPSSCANPIVLTNNLICTATFTSKQVALTVSKTGEGEVSVNGIACGTNCSKNYDLNTQVTLTAKPTNGYKINWSDDCSFRGSYLSFSITMDTAKNCTANFIKNDTFAITLNKVGTGSGTVVSNSASYVAGATVNLTATPDANSTFNGWSSPCNDSFTMPANNLTCTATFTSKQVALTVSKTGEGEISVNGIACGTNCSKNYDLNTQVTLTAKPANGYKVNWLDDCSFRGSYLSFSITMDAAKKCTANFTKNDTFAITLNKVGTGSGTVVSNSASYVAGATVNLTATPDANSTFSGWSSSPCNNSFTMPAQNLTCTATFTSKQFTLTVSKVGNGQVSKGGIFPANAAVSLTATADPEYQFVSWSPTICKNLSVMPAQNLICTATFEKKSPQISQCTTYNISAHPQVFVPCVKVGGIVYEAGMNLIATSPTMRFEVDLNTLQPSNLIPNTQCAVFPAPNTPDHLRINCLDLGTDKYWVDLKLVSRPNAIQFDLVNFGK